MRYNKTPIVINNTEQWRKIAKEKGLNYIRQTSTPTIKHPDAEDILAIEESERVWSFGDRLWKIAQNAYNDPKLWWVIAQWNQKPTDAHFKIGDIYFVPFPLPEVLRLYGM